MHAWHISILHDALPALIRKWEPKLGVEVAGYFLQRIKTKWGACDHRVRNMRLNTELVKKPKDSCRAKRATACSAEVWG